MLSAETGFLANWQGILVIFGALLVLIAILGGGGFEIYKLKIPVVGREVRIVCFVLGAIFCFTPVILSKPPTGPTGPTSPTGPTGPTPPTGLTGPTSPHKRTLTAVLDLLEAEQPIHELLSFSIPRPPNGLLQDMDYDHRLGQAQKWQLSKGKAKDPHGNEITGYWIFQFDSKPKQAWQCDSDRVLSAWNEQTAPQPYPEGWELFSFKPFDRQHGVVRVWSVYRRAYVSFDENLKKFRCNGEREEDAAQMHIKL